MGLKGAAGELSIGGLLGGLIALFVAFLIGGWAVGRIARFDGGRNGLVTAIWPILLAGLLALLGVLFGEKYNVFQQVNNLPQPFSRDALTLGAIVSGLVALVVMLIAGFLGGKWGARYHARVDEEIARTDEGGLVTGRR